MLAQEDIEQIERLVEQVIARQPEKLNANVRYELDLRERTVRVEEELKHQRELMIQGFDTMGKRFEQVDKRFEQVDKRFEDMRKDMNTGFVEMNRRLDRFMYWTLGLVVSATLLIINFK
jgi:DNA anti-recombination protein RmuC